MKDLQLKVDWTSYAAKYDMLMSYNPFYQALHQEVLDLSDHWEIEAGDTIVDFGAGTGNYSVALAQKFPHARIIHIDRDEGMNAIAIAKQTQLGLSNLEIRGQDSLNSCFPEASIKAGICIHSLYTLSEPRQLLYDIFDYLEKDGYAIFVDPGRIVKVLDWQIAIGIRMLRQYGLRKTIQILREAKEVSQQNRAISKLQADGTYWTHTHQEFCNTIQAAGFELIESGLTFRGISDWVLAQKM